ncbi:N-acetylmuramoyl-L-alanine amidase [Nocardioides sp. GXZ039]|uniref:N-acetylmuramoyl-L-alanine amidase n=1 Tax=Nocardioides sp. GXZ039 TaxID=3136018 RepID=UPI0030F44EB6
MSSPHRSSTHPKHPRFVTACQQLLVLGVICAVLTPAARVISIELGPAPDEAASGGNSAPGAVPSAQFAAYAKNQQVPTRVPTATVDATVREVPLTAPRGARVAPGLLKATAKVVPGGGSQLVSTPQKVTGYGAVGVTWEHGATVPEDQISIQVRTRDESGWSDWLAMDYHDDHGPDPDSAEGRSARPGTDELLVGEVDDVQVRIDSDAPAPADLKLAVIDPGVASDTAEELPAIQTGPEGSTTATPSAATVPSGAEQSDSTGSAGADATLTSSSGDLQLAAATYTPRPTIYSRAQWGADERLRDKSSLHYYEVHAGFVHHTVNANNYKAKDVPAILRGIYAYHTQSRGWSDIGYNYLVDRFGRIWEGRYGGVDRPVVGAHTLGYNDDSFAMSAIGNFETAQPSQAMIQAYGALFGWKLSLHGVNAASTKQFVTSRNFQAINGHRDAASTACPGKYLYAKIPEIRKLAAAAQAGFAGRELESNIGRTDLPDVLFRRKSDGRAVVVPLVRRASGIVAGKSITTNVDLSGATAFFNAGDWDRDGHSDMILRGRDGTLYVTSGNGKGGYGPGRRLATGFKDVQLLAAAGDLTGDGWPDLIGQPKGGSMRIYPGLGNNGLGASYTAYSAVDAGRQIPVGRWDADGAPDLLFRKGNSLRILRGNGPGGLTGSIRTMKLSLAPYDMVTGISDVGMTGHSDLVVRKRNGELYLIQGYRTGFGAPILLGRGFGIYDRIA